MGNRLHALRRDRPLKLVASLDRVAELLQILKRRFVLEQSFGLERAAGPDICQIDLGEMLPYVGNELLDALEIVRRTNPLEPLLRFLVRKRLGLKIEQVIFGENKLEVVDIRTPVRIDALDGID